MHLIFKRLSNRKKKTTNGDDNDGKSRLLNRRKWAADAFLIELCWHFFFSYMRICLWLRSVFKLISSFRGHKNAGPTMTFYVFGFLKRNQFVSSNNLLSYWISNGQLTMRPTTLFLNEKKKKFHASFDQIIIITLNS